MPMVQGSRLLWSFFSVPRLSRASQSIGVWRSKIAHGWPLILRSNFKLILRFVFGWMPPSRWLVWCPANNFKRQSPPLVDVKGFRDDGTAEMPLCAQRLQCSIEVLAIVEEFRTGSDALFQNCELSVANE
jgi:hypothetical protein